MPIRGQRGEKQKKQDGEGKFRLPHPVSFRGIMRFGVDQGVGVSVGPGVFVAPEGVSVAAVPPVTVMATQGESPKILSLIGFHPPKALEVSGSRWSRESNRDFHRHAGRDSIGECDCTSTHLVTADKSKFVACAPVAGAVILYSPCFYESLFRFYVRSIGYGHIIYKGSTVAGLNATRGSCGTCQQARGLGWQGCQSR